MGIIEFFYDKHKQEKIERYREARKKLSEIEKVKEKFYKRWAGKFACEADRVEYLRLKKEYELRLADFREAYKNSPHTHIFY